MRVVFLVANVNGMGGTARSVITQAGALADASGGGHDVAVISLLRSSERPHYSVAAGVEVRYLVEALDEQPVRTCRSGLLSDEQAAGLHTRESLLVPRRWDRTFTALYDVALEDFLPGLQADVLVTTSPELLAAAIQLVPDRVAVVHQEHRSSSHRTADLEPLLLFAPRADVVACLTPPMGDWLRARLGSVSPEVVVMPNPLPAGHHPRSRLDEPVIVAAGRLVPEKQFHHLVRAFAEIADEIPTWRLRIFGEGSKRHELSGTARKLGLFDRVELPGATEDMVGEWAGAGLSALCSKAEGFPLVMQEAMAAGVPVVSYDCPAGPRYLIEHEVNGLLTDPGSPAGLAAGILRLVRDDELRRRMGAAALESSRAYEPSLIARRWGEIFERAVQRRSAHRSGRLGGLLVTAEAAPSLEPDVAPARSVEGLTPARARAGAMRWAADAAVAAGLPWFVIPPHAADSPVVVVPMDARTQFLTALARDDAPPYLSLRDPERRGWPERRGTIAAMSAELRRGRTSVIAVEPWPRTVDGASIVGQDCTVEVQFWGTDPDGALVAPTANRYGSRIPPGSATAEVEVHGVRAPTLPLMITPTVDECRAPVDVVYTWVDGNDAGWNDARERSLARSSGTAQTRESSGQARFLSRDELRYSLRSLHLFAPWVHRIHLVTAGQTPEWLDTSHPLVTVVDHREILPPDALPTFNSHAIETALHRVPDLAEQFVYFNDDVFLGRPVRPEIFFNAAGSFATFMSPTTVGLTDLPGAAPHLKAGWNNRGLLEEAFGVSTTHNLAHTPHPHRRSVLEEVSARFPDAVAGTARAPFRSDTDISMLSSLGQHYGLLTGTAHVGVAEHAFVNLSKTDVAWQLRLLLARDQDFFCLGDHHDHALKPARLDAILADFFEKCFPIAAPWELPG